MSNEALDTLTEQSQLFFGPFMEANQLMMDQLQKLVDLQVNAVPGYADLHLSQLQKLSTVKDADSFKKFLDDQVATSNALREKIMADSQALSDLGVSFMTELSKLGEKNVKGAASKATKATTTAAKATKQATNA